MKWSPYMNVIAEMPSTKPTEQASTEATALRGREKNYGNAFNQNGYLFFLEYFLEKQVKCPEFLCFRALLSRIDVRNLTWNPLGSTLVSSC